MKLSFLVAVGDFSSFFHSIDMYSPIFVFGFLLLVIGVSAQNQCRSSVNFYEVLSAPEGLLTIDDEEGSRQIKGTLFSSTNCSSNPSVPSGRRFNGIANMTSLSQNGFNPTSCEVEVRGSEYIINSFQAVVIESNGWPLDDLAFTVADIDGVRQARESTAVFGLRNGGLVLPNMELTQNSSLLQQNFTMPEAANSLLDLPLGTVTIPGVLIREPNLFQCPFTGPRAVTCAVSVSFPVPVDSFVVIYMLEDSGTLAGRSLALLSPFSTSCGCRCRENNPGTRDITVPVLGQSGECTKKETSGPKIECDVLGGRWCLKEPQSKFILNGNTLPNGNLGCTETDGFKLLVQQEFTPNPNFTT